MWLETVPPDSDLPGLPSFDKQGDILLFLKLYNPYTETVAYCGHLAVPIEGTKVGTCNCGNLS